MTILNSYKAWPEFIFCTILFMLIGACVGMLIVCVVALIRDSFTEDITNFLIFSAILGCIIGGCIGSNCILNGPETRYEIILDDDYSANEFLSKYEIIEQRGQIYLVEEKDD